MKINVTGKQITVSPRLREYVENSLKSTVNKYFEESISATVAFSKEGNQTKVDLSVHPRRGILLQGSSLGGDVNSAFDLAHEHISTRLRRYKKRLVDQKNRSDIEAVSLSVLAPEYGNDEELPAEDASPITIAELEAEIPSCTVSGAVMRMDLADMPAIMFRNIAHGGLNMVYRRKDGNIGWIDPKNDRPK